MKNQILALVLSTSAMPVVVVRFIARSSRPWWVPSLLLLLLSATVTDAADYSFITNNNEITITEYGGIGSTVSIPDAINGLPVTSIGAEAFASSYTLTSVTIPVSVTSIGDRAFGDCNQLTAITVAALNPAYSSLSGVLFNKAQTTLIQCPGGKTGSYTVPSTVIMIEALSFVWCSSLSSVTIPASVTSIGDRAFGDCGGLTSITVAALNPSYSSLSGVLFNKAQTTLIQCPGGKAGSYAVPATVANIDNYAFESCLDLTSVTVPSSVTTIGAHAFATCFKLTSVTVAALNPNYSSLAGVLFDKSQTTLILCPGGKSGNYTIPSTVTTIGDDAFSTCINLTSVTIPPSVTSIGENAFFFCSNLNTLTIPASVTSIGDWAFYACPKLISMTIPAGVTSIGIGTFSSCDSLTSVTLPASVTNVGWYAFSRCSSLAGVYFYGNAPTLGWWAFDGAIYATVYYLSGATGWGATFGGRPTQMLLSFAAVTITNPGAQQGWVGTMFTLPLEIVADSTPFVTVSGLPSGLKYNAATRVISGVPTVAVTNRVVTISAKNSKGTATQTFFMTVDPLPPWAWGTFNGWYKAGSDEVGVASMVVTKAGKMSGKCSIAGLNYTFSATSYTNGSSPLAGFRFTGCAKTGKTTVPLAVVVNQSLAAVGPALLGMAEGRINGAVGGEAPLVLYRNVWSDPDMKPVATNLDGYYTATLPGDGSFGSGYIAFTLKTGVVKTAGKLADDTAVSMGSIVLVDESNRCFTVLYSAPKNYKGGSFFGVAEFLRQVAPDAPVIVRPWEGEAFVWNNYNPQATDVYDEQFRRETGLVGGWYDKLGNLYAYYSNKTLAVSASAPEAGIELLAGASRYASVWWSPDGQPISLVTNALGVLTGLGAQKVWAPVYDGAVWDYESVSNTVGLVFSLTRPTGVFKGSFKAWFDYGTTHTSKGIPFAGVLTPEREDKEDGIDGRGFYLWPDKGQYTNSMNRVLSYPFKWSCDFLLFSER